MSRPFPLDPGVLDRIRPMQQRDCPAVAGLHAAAMGDSLWARLGERFLRELYRGLVDSPLFLGFVYDDPGAGRVRGFIAGSTDASRMMREVFRSRAPLLAAAALPGLLRRPGLSFHLLRTASYFRLSGGGAGQVPAESLFCSFEPELRGRRISGHANKVLFDELLARGHRLVKISTEADNAAARRQLRSWGFEERGRFRFYGKQMVACVLDLEASERVEPVSRHPAV